MVWVGIERFSTQVVQFVIGVIIARILMPSDYGIVGMLAIFIAIAQTFLDSGFASALIQKKDRTEIDYSTVFYFNIIISLVLYAIFYVSAPLIAAFYNIPILTDVTRISTLSIIIGGLTIVQQAKLTIDLNFRLQAVGTLSASIISGVCGIFMAYKGFGVWALVFQNLFNAFLRSTIFWIFSKWHPLWAFSTASFHRLFSFGSKLLCSGLINTIYSNIYTLVIGKAFNSSEVGFFNRANQFAMLPPNTITQMVVTVNFPILSQMQDDNEKLVKTYKKLICASMFILCPILIVMVAVGYPLIDVVLGEKWLPCVPYLQILCLGFLFEPLTHINLNLLYVKGRTDLVLKLELIKKPIAFLLLFVTIPLGIWWICLGKAIYCVIAFMFNCYYTKKILNYGFFEQIKELSNIFLNGIIMLVITLLVISLFHSTSIQLIVGLCAGIATYSLYAFITKDKSFNDIKELLLQKLHHA